MTDDRVPIKRKMPKFVDRFRDRYGKMRLYFRRKGGPRVALDGEPGSVEFRESYAAALAEVADVANSKMTGGIRGNRIIEADKVEPLIGVYLLILKGKVVYIGSSLHMPKRVQDHRSNGRAFDRAYYIATKAMERFALERTLIKAFHPSQNKTHRAFETSTHDLTN